MVKKPQSRIRHIDVGCADTNRHVGIYLEIGRAMGLIKTLWYGDVALAKAAWVYGAVGSIILAFPPNLVNATGVNYAQSGALSLFILTHSVIVLAYTAFISVAIWRSAAKYTGLWLWALMVRVSIVLILLGVGAAFLWV